MCCAILLPAPRPNAVVSIASKMGDFVNEKAPPPPGILPPPGGLNGTLSGVVPS